MSGGGGVVNAQGIHEEHAGQALLIYCLLKICIGNANEAVSYTHLTLPTSDLV